MEQKLSKKEQTRLRILESVHKGFRQHGFAAAGVDGLAKEAGVTSGAFYAHLGSKNAAFRETIADSIDTFLAAVLSYQEQYGANWLSEFADFYLNEKRNCPLGQSCGLQSLSSDVSRSDDETKSLFENKLVQVRDAVADSDVDSASVEKAWCYLAMLIGGVTLARAVEKPETADEIANAVNGCIDKF